MTEYELLSLVNDVFRDMDHMVEFWLSATFAVIVARHAASESLSDGVLWVIAFLYLAATAFSVTRYRLAAGRGEEYRERLTSLGFEAFWQPLEMERGMTFNVLALWIVGTLATLYFLLHRHPVKADSGTG